MNAYERRQSIWETLCTQRFVTANKLAEKYHVSIRTIYNDIDALSLSYPLVSRRGRYEGGTQIPEGFDPKRLSYSSKETALLMRLKEGLEGEEKVIMDNIIHKLD